MASHLVFLPGESHEQRSPVSYSPWGCKELDIKKKKRVRHDLMTRQEEERITPLPEVF